MCWWWFYVSCLALMDNAANHQSRWVVHTLRGFVMLWCWQWYRRTSLGFRGHHDSFYPDKHKHNTMQEMKVPVDKENKINIPVKYEKGWLKWISTSNIAWCSKYALTCSIRDRISPWRSFVTIWNRTKPSRCRMKRSDKQILRSWLSETNFGSSCEEYIVICRSIVLLTAMIFICLVHSARLFIMTHIKEAITIHYDTA